jgi:hypothetical protein
MEWQGGEIIDNFPKSLFMGRKIPGFKTIKSYWESTYKHLPPYMKKDPMQMNPVNSSNIKLVGYDVKTLTLRVEFHNGAIWEYSPILETAHAEMMAEESVGKWFNTHVKDNTTVTATKIKDKVK